MRLFFVVFILSFYTPYIAAAAVSTHSVKIGQNNYEVKLKSVEKKIEVKKVKGPNSPHLRVLIYRKDKRPLEINLQTLTKTESPLLYSAKIDQWNDSFIGFQLQFSFDKKTWKRLGKKIIP